MKKIIIGLFLLILAIPFYCQTQQQNLDKYWSYRQRLRDKFMVVSPDVMEYGTNIPAAEIFYNDPTNPAVNRISWGDENGNMCQYLSVLATELWILKNNGQNYSVTLNELYYAMLALERLDNFSEANLRAFNLQANQSEFIESAGILNNWQNGDINGFSLRDDVTNDFWNRHKNNGKFDVGLCDGFLKRWGNCQFAEENSHDVLEHIMLGLALVSKLVGTESVANTPCNGIISHISSYLTNKGIITSDSHVNFSLWAKDIVKRYINYMQYDGTYDSILGSTHWILMNQIGRAHV